MQTPLRTALAAALVVLAAPIATAHDLERTQVSIAFARDGSFTLDVSNDPNWLALRMEPFRGNFIDRVVLFVDGHEIRPTSVELIKGDTAATYRMRGRMPVEAHTLRWYYGLVIDPYPLTIRRADGRVVVEEVGGDAWSREIDLRGQFRRAFVSERQIQIFIVALFVVPLLLRLGKRRAFLRDFVPSRLHLF